MDAARLRAAFPVFERGTYLNAGTCGPLSSAAQRAAADAWRFATEEGRGSSFYARLVPLAEELRERYARALNAPAAEVALTTGTSDGCGHVIAGMDLGPGDEVVTADDEHPGLTGPLIAAREQRGVTIRAVPLAEIPGAIGKNTKLVACSHVSWHSGAVAPVAEIVTAARAVGAPVLLDGAQGIGAVSTDVGELGVDFYAGSGQKWLCGPVGCGMLWIAPGWLERLKTPRVGYGGHAEPARGLQSTLVADAHRHDSQFGDLSILAASVAAFDILEEAGLAAIAERAVGQAAQLAAALADAGFDVVPRGDSTLVAWAVPGGEDAAVAARDRLAELGITIRDLPGTGRLRASVGAWNDEDDLDRLLAALS